MLVVISWLASRGLLGGSFEASWGPLWGLWGLILGLLGASWGPLGALLGLLGALLGPSWGFLGPSWAQLGAQLGPLGAVCGLLEPSWRPSWGQKPPRSKKHCQLRIKLHLEATTLERHAPEVDFALFFTRISQPARRSSFGPEGGGLGGVSPLPGPLPQRFCPRQRLQDFPPHADGGRRISICVFAQTPAKTIFSPNMFA